MNEKGPSLQIAEAYNREDFKEGDVAITASP